MATPEFILKLREKIGHDPLWLIGVTAFVEDGRGRVLLGRRADTGDWALVYGINEPGEEPAATVVREVREETGVDCVPVALASVKAAPAITTQSPAASRAESAPSARSQQAPRRRTLTLRWAGGWKPVEIRQKRPHSKRRQLLKT